MTDQRELSGKAPVGTLGHISYGRAELVQAVVAAVYRHASLDASQPPYLPESAAATFWPGWEARKFIAMIDAYQTTTTAVEPNSVGTPQGVNQND